MQHSQRLMASLTAGCLVALAGCASPPVPREQLAVGQASIEAAQSAGAAEFAPVELNRARDKFTQAQLAVKEDRLVSARRLAEEADVDAQVARSKANAERAERAAREVNKGISTLRQQLDQSAAPANSSMPAQRP